MIYAISRYNRADFGRELDTMFRDRKKVFVDWLKWNVPVVDGVFEMDQYDGDDTVYIVAADPETGQHWASMRLMPTTKPHMLKDVFSSLCEGEVPTGPEIWEGTRICLTPSLPRDEARRYFRFVWLGAIEFSVAHGIETITGLTHAIFLNSLLAAGIDLEPLGPPKEFDGMQFGAVRIPVDAEYLARQQKRLDQRAPVLRYHRISVAA